MKEHYVKITSEPKSMKFKEDLPLTMKCEIVPLNLHIAYTAFLLPFRIYVYIGKEWANQCRTSRLDEPVSRGGELSSLLLIS